MQSGFTNKLNVTIDNRNYTCYYPDLNLSQVKKSVDVDPKSIEHPSAYLRSLKGDCAKGTDGMWTYDVCFEDHIRQYRPQESIIIGKRPKENIMNDDYYGEIYDDGAFCDEANHKRVVETRYRCDPYARTPIIKSVKEPVMCLYYIEVLTDKICQHPKYKKEKKRDIEVQCFNYLDRDEYMRVSKEIELENKKKLDLEQRESKERIILKMLEELSRDMSMEIDNTLLSELPQLFQA